MKRYLEPDPFRRVAKDFKFLVRKIRASHGELDLRLRDGYLSLYYKGNTLAKVTPRADDYQVEIHEKFVPEGFFKGDNRFDGERKRRGSYRVFNLEPARLHPFFQTKYLDKIAANIARVNYGEEITFEHLLVTDNLEREDMIILDRQVTDAELGGRRMDLLAAVRVRDHRYRFLVMEIKLGSNPELTGKVQEQLASYIHHINGHLAEWAESYQETYCQLKALRLFDVPEHESIEVVDDARGLICVGGYTGLAEVAIRELQRKYPDARVQLFKNRIIVKSP
jgi:hypothetical protein